MAVLEARLAGGHVGDTYVINPQDHGVSVASLQASGALWNCRVVHRMFGPGVVAESTQDGSFSVRFEQPVDGKTERTFIRTALVSGPFSEITIPHGVYVQLTALIRIEAQRALRLQQEVENAARLKRLKKQFGVGARRDEGNEEWLLAILQALEAGRPLGDEQVQLLKAQELHQVVAAHHEVSFALSGDLWEAVKASSAWRRVGQPEKALALTEGDHVATPVQKSALITTRGGAFKDLGDLPMALKCARMAVGLNPSSYRPHNLLGAVFYRLGRFEDGDESFARAVQTGSPLEAQRSEIVSAIRRSPPSIRRELVRHLQRRDPASYRWASTYFGDSADRL